MSSLRLLLCLDPVNTPVKNFDHRYHQKQGSQNDQYERNIFLYLQHNRH